MLIVEHGLSKKRRLFITANFIDEADIVLLFVRELHTETSVKQCRGTPGLEEAPYEDLLFDGASVQQPVHIAGVFLASAVNSLDRLLAPARVILVLDQQDVVGALKVKADTASLTGQDGDLEMGTFVNRLLILTPLFSPYVSVNRN